MSGSNKFAPFTYDSLDPNQRQKLFGMFEESYRKETGQAWSQPKFESRAQNWHFYGDEDGFVAVRPQRSGMKKLVGVAGSPKSIIKGVDQLQQETGLRIDVEFGGRPYRAREIMRPYSGQPLPPGWQPQITLPQTLRDMVQSRREALVNA